MPAPASVPAPPRHIRLTPHAGAFSGPVVGTTASRAHRNVIGTHSGSYGVWRALAVAAGALKRDHKADLRSTRRSRGAISRAGRCRARTT